MLLHKETSFDLNWRKQIIAFELLALVYAKKKKFKTGLKAIYQAQTIVAMLDETIDRNLDYLIAVNTLTGYLLLQIEKPLEAYEFLVLAERVAHQLAKAQIKGKTKSTLEGMQLGVISEQDAFDVADHEDSRRQSVNERLKQKNNNGNDHLKTLHDAEKIDHLSLNVKQKPGGQQASPGRY